MSEEQKETTELIAVSVDDRERQQMMIDRVAAEDGHQIEYILLSDPGHRVIDRYGVFNEDSEGTERPRPHPTTLVIDRDGVVRWRFTEVDYRVRPSNEDILEALEAVETGQG